MLRFTNFHDKSKKNWIIEPEKDLDEKEEEEEIEKDEDEHNSDDNLVI